MDAVILAAGQGLRLRAAVGELPKCLIDVGGQSVIEHQLACLRRVGVRRICVITGYEEHQVRDRLGSAADCITNDRYMETNSLYSLFLAADWVNGSFMLINGDVVAHPAIYGQVAANSNSALAFDSASGQDAEHMKISVTAGRLRSIGKRLEASVTSGENVGILKFTSVAARSLFDEARRLLSGGATRDWAPAAVERVALSHEVQCIDIHPLPWIEIDFDEDLHRARTTVWPMIQSALNGGSVNPVNGHVAANGKHHGGSALHRNGRTPA